MCAGFSVALFVSKLSMLRKRRYGGRARRLNGGGAAAGVSPKPWFVRIYMTVLLMQARSTLGVHARTGWGREISLRPTQLKALDVSGFQLLDLVERLVGISL